MIQYGPLPKPGPLLHFTDISSSGPGYGMPAAHPSGSAASGFNFGASILNDPIFKATQAQINAANQGAQSQAGVGFGQALANYGQIPDLTAAAQQLGLNPSDPMYGILTGAASNPNTVSAANALTQQGLSTEAQLAQQHQTAIQNLMNNLAARGAVQSGDTGVGLGLEEQSNAQRQYQAQQSLLDTLGKLVSGYNTQQQAGIGQLQQAAGQAAARQIALSPNISAASAATLAPLIASLTPATPASSAAVGGV